MNKKNLFIFSQVILFFLISQCCLQLKIELPEEPGLKLDYFVISDVFPEQTKLEKHLINRNVSLKLKEIYSILKVSDVEKSGIIRWKWYDPHKKLTRTSPEIRINKDNMYLQYFVTWDILQADIFSGKPGFWTVTVFLNGEFFVKKKFRLQ